MGDIAEFRVGDPHRVVGHTVERDPALTVKTFDAAADGGFRISAGGNQVVFSELLDALDEGEIGQFNRWNLEETEDAVWSLCDQL